MTRNTYSLVLLLSLAGLLLNSCTQKLVVTRYYLLSTDQKITEPDTEPGNITQPLPNSVEIGRFRISKAYDRERIAVRTQSNEIYYYFYHSWAIDPQSAIRFFVWNQVYQSNLFQACEMEFFKGTPDYQITGLIDQIERTDMKKQSAAHLKMNLELRQYPSGELILNHHFDRYVPMRESASMNTFAQLISQILLEECDTFIMQINSALNQ